PKAEHAVSLSAIDVFLTKSEEWAYEAEWRLIDLVVDLTSFEQWFSIHAPYPLHLRQFPRSAVKEIILCVRSSAETKQAAADIRRESYPHATLLQATLDEREFKLNFVQVEET